MRSDTRRTAEHLLASCGAEKAGNDTIHWPSNDDIEALARDYLARTKDQPGLGQRAAPLISTPVLEKFAAQFRRAASTTEQYTPDDVRRWLTETALDARQRSDGSWSVRGVGGIEVTLRVMFSGRLAVITSANLRTTNRHHDGRTEQMATLTANAYDDLVYRVLDSAAELTALQSQGKVRPDIYLVTRLRRLTASLAGATLARRDTRRLVAGKSALKQARDALAALDAAPASPAPAGSDFENELLGKLAEQGIPQSALGKVVVIGPGAPAFPRSPATPPAIPSPSAPNTPSKLRRPRRTPR